MLPRRVKIPPYSSGRPLSTGAGAALARLSPTLPRWCPPWSRRESPGSRETPSWCHRASREDKKERKEERKEGRNRRSRKLFLPQTLPSETQAAEPPTCSLTSQGPGVGEAHGSPPFPRGGWQPLPHQLHPWEGRNGCELFCAGPPHHLPTPGPRGAGNTHLAPPPIGPAGPRRGSAAGAAAGVGGRDCGRVVGARRWRSSPGPLRGLSVPRRRPGPCRAAASAVEARCTGKVQLLSDGAGSPGPAGTCRRGQLGSASAGSPVPQTEGEGRWPRRS